MKRPNQTREPEHRSHFDPLVEIDLSLLHLPFHVKGNCGQAERPLSPVVMIFLNISTPHPSHLEISHSLIVIDEAI
jgi:hypothetical protein